MEVDVGRLWLLAGSLVDIQQDELFLEMRLRFLPGSCFSWTDRRIVTQQPPPVAASCWQ